MRILVTGGAGFIGSHLVDALVTAGHQVRVLDNFDAQVHGDRKPDYLNPRAEYQQGSVAHRETLHKALEGVEAVFHFAAAVGVGQSMYQIEHYVSVNVLGTAILLDLIVNEKHVLKRLVVASSMSIYGEGQSRCSACGPVVPSLRPTVQLEHRQWDVLCPTCGKPTVAEPTSEEKPLRPTSVYAVSKRDQEELVLSVGHGYGIPAVALRFFNVYGPRQALSNPYTGVCAIFSARIKNRKPPIIFEDGQQTRDFVSVHDIVQANVLALSHPDAPGRALNVGTGRATNLVDIARTLGTLYGYSEAPEITQKFRAGDIRHCAADIRAIAALGYRPTVTLEDGLRELAEWGRRIDAKDRVEQAAQELVTRGLTKG